jgi:CO/xanthine dehydrogenase FAD-binding subunit
MFEVQMIIEYQRPETISQALALLARDKPVSYPLGGGTVLNQGMDGDYAVVDLQALELGSILKVGNQIQAGATATLQQLLDFKELPDALHAAIKQETNYNLRQMATIAGTIVSASGRSPLATVLLAMDVQLRTLNYDGSETLVKLGDWFPIRVVKRPDVLITQLVFSSQLKLAFEMIARSPADQPIVCAAVALWPSGRTRLALGGWGTAPVLGMDGPEAGGIKEAGLNAYSNAGDEWASADYRQEMAGLLAERCLKHLKL